MELLNVAAKNFTGLECADRLDIQLSLSNVMLMLCLLFMLRPVINLKGLFLRNLNFKKCSKDF